jgi:hypothetical protein
MFINTIAVGPFDPVATSCFTGATVALPLLNCKLYADNAGVVIAHLRFAARAIGTRSDDAIFANKQRSRKEVVSEAYGRKKDTEAHMWNLVCIGKFLANDGYYV